MTEEVKKLIESVKTYNRQTNMSFYSTDDYVLKSDFDRVVEILCKEN